MFLWYQHCLPFIVAGTHPTWGSSSIELVSRTKADPVILAKYVTALTHCTELLVSGLFKAIGKGSIVSHIT
ncbi:hypothetical protein C5167_006200 [Papaver somniferum]|uniref:Uncharacterized protein n=1 Tax=Papaver somniferum TaxID=3469 RepID=A0A4Y7JG47_PAPSO|nr:hypothetical protein C5167_006200 [Papaver somniferum]